MELSQFENILRTGEFDKEVTTLGREKLYNSLKNIIIKQNESKRNELIEHRPNSISSLTFEKSLIYNQLKSISFCKVKLLYGYNNLDQSKQLRSKRTKQIQTNTIKSDANITFTFDKDGYKIDDTFVIKPRQKQRTNRSIYQLSDTLIKLSFNKNATIDGSTMLEFCRIMENIIYDLGEITMVTTIMENINTKCTTVDIVNSKLYQELIFNVLTRFNSKSRQSKYTFYF